MVNQFGLLLKTFIKRNASSVRQLARSTQIPHQTISNWCHGSQPRWHPTLEDDLLRLGWALGLSNLERQQLLHFAGLLSAEFMTSFTKEKPMISIHQLPTGWFAAGSHPAQYEMGVDTTEYGVSAYIKTHEPVEGFGTFMQTFSAKHYREKRLRFSAKLKAQDVYWAALWMRVDDAQDQILAFDNMRQRPIVQT